MLEDKPTYVTGKLQRVVQHVLDSLVVLLLWSFEDNCMGANPQLQQDVLVYPEHSQQVAVVSLRTL